MAIDRSETAFFTGLGAIVLSHGACLIAGAYKGVMHAQGKEADILFGYFWGANIAATSFAFPQFTKSNVYDFGTMQFQDRLKGGATGMVAAPLEYILGYGAGYVGQKIVENVFLNP